MISVLADICLSASGHLQCRANADTEDDQVLVAGADPVALDTLLAQDGDTVTMTANPLDLVFVER